MQKYQTRCAGNGTALVVHVADDPATISIWETETLIERIAIVGSRNYPNRMVVQDFIERLPKACVVLSGGAAGVDTWAVEAAKDVGLEASVFEADWNAHGRKAGPIRNASIVAECDRLVAFWDGKSRGTLNSIYQAYRATKPVEVYDGRGKALILDNVIAVARKHGVADQVNAALKG